MEFSTRFGEMKNNTSFSISNRNFKILVEKHDDIYFRVTVTNQSDDSTVISCIGWFDQNAPKAILRRDGKLSFKDRDISTFVYLLIMQKATVRNDDHNLMEIKTKDFDYIFSVMVNCCKEVNDLIDLKF